MGAAPNWLDERSQQGSLLANLRRRRERAMRAPKRLERLPKDGETPAVGMRKPQNRGQEHLGFELAQLFDRSERLLFGLPAFRRQFTKLTRVLPVECLDQSPPEGSLLHRVGGRHFDPGNPLDKHPRRTDLKHQCTHKEELGDITHGSTLDRKPSRSSAEPADLYSCRAISLFRSAGFIVH